MGWSVVAGTDDGMELRKDGLGKLVLGLVSPEISPISADLLSPPVRRGTQKRQLQPTPKRHDEADDDDTADDPANPAEKKRRLTIEQVRYLEMSFEMDNKLEPERKVAIAKRLGLRPRQVAIWFQNRRARWKNKQLEQDYEALKSKYNAAVKENETVLKENEFVMEENKRLQAEIVRLTALLQGSGNPSVYDGMDGALDGEARMTEAASEGADDVEGGEQNSDQEVSLFSDKSELTYPTKSDDQSEVLDSGRSYPSAATAEADAELELPQFTDINLASATATATAMICPLMKLDDSTLLSSDELLGNIFNPLLFQQLAASGVCLEDACNFLFNWEDQSPPGFAWCECE